MNTIEQEIRIALANDFGKRAGDIYSDPGRAAAIRKSVGDSVAGVLENLVRSGDVSKLDAFELNNDLTPKLVEGYSAEKVSQHIAGMWMDDRAAIEGKCWIFFEMAKEKGLELPQGLHSVYEFLVSSTQRKDNVVADLVGKAEKEGIQNATNENGLRAAVRREYTTAHDYVSATTGLMDSIVTMVGELSNLMTKGDGVMEKLLPVVIKQVAQIYMSAIIKADVEVLYGA